VTPLCGLRLVTTVGRASRRHGPAFLGVALLYVLSSGSASVFGSLVERLSTPNNAAYVSLQTVDSARPLSSPELAGIDQYETFSIGHGSWLRHPVDRPYELPVPPWMTGPADFAELTQFPDVPTNPPART